MQVCKICPFYIRIHFAAACIFAHFQTLAPHKCHVRLVSWEVSGLQDKALARSPDTTPA